MIAKWWCMRKSSIFQFYSRSSPHGIKERIRERGDGFQFYSRSSVRFTGFIDAMKEVFQFYSRSSHAHCVGRTSCFEYRPFNSIVDHQDIQSIMRVQRLCLSFNSIVDHQGERETDETPEQIFQFYSRSSHASFFLRHSYVLFAFQFYSRSSRLSEIIDAIENFLTFNSIVDHLGIILALYFLVSSDFQFYSRSSRIKDFYNDLRILNFQFYSRSSEKKEYRLEIGASDFQFYSRSSLVSDSINDEAVGVDFQFYSRSSSLWNSDQRVSCLPLSIL